MSRPGKDLRRSGARAATSGGPTTAQFEEAAALREALRLFSRRSELVIRENGLTPRSFQLLLMVKTARDGSGHASLSELEERLQLGKSTITELVTRNEERGLIRRELDRNRRGAIVVRLTPAGNRRLTATVAANGDERGRLRDALARLGG